MAAPQEHPVRRSRPQHGRQCRSGKLFLAAPCTRAARASETATEGEMGSWPLDDQRPIRLVLGSFFLASQTGSSVINCVSSGSSRSSTSEFAFSLSNSLRQKRALSPGQLFPFSPLHPYTHRTQRLVWVPWCDSRNRQWQLSTAETRKDWRSDHPVVLDVPSAAIFSLRRARAAQSLTCDFVDGGAVGWLLSARTSFSPLSLDSSAGEKVYLTVFMVFSG